MNKMRSLRHLESPAKRTGIWADLKTEIKKRLLTALVGTAVGVSGAIVFWLSPLKQIVFHFIWQESADIMVVIPVEVDVGASVPVSVVVTPTSPIPVSDGALSITSSDTALVVKRGTSATPQIATTIILPEPKDEPLVLQAAAPGRFTITAKLKNKFREYIAQGNILVRPLKQPTIENLSGQWNIKMWHALGDMDLNHDRSEHRGDVAGFFKLKQPQIRGTITGFVDGGSFNAELWKQGETRRKWLLEAQFNQNGDYVEVKGEITRQILKDSDWVQEGKREEFYATSDPRR